MMNTLTRRFFRSMLCAFGLLTLAPLAWSQNSIEGLDVTQQGGQVLVRLTLKAPLAAAPGSFTIANPARIAFDFPGFANNLGRNSQDVGEGVLRSLNVVQAGDRTRLVLNLRNMVAYDAKTDGNSLLITLTQVATAGSAGGGAGTRFAEGRADMAHGIKDINFRRGRNGEGRVIVDLSDTSTGVDIRQQGQTIVVEFLKTSLPDALRKRLDVVDFATPVQTISTLPQGDNVRMVIEPKGLWEQSAYQTETQFVLEVKPVQFDPNKLVQGTARGYSGEKLSLNFQSVEVRSVLNVIADFTDLNIITSDTVSGNLTLRLKDVPWDQALDIILQTRGLDMRKNGNVVWIAPRDELATKEKLALESQQQIGELEQLRTESFALSYAKGDDFVKLLTNPQQRILSKRGSAVVDARTNQVFVQDVTSRLDDVRKLLGQIDIAVRQVLIEARIVEATDTFSKNLGARLGWNAGASNKFLGDRNLGSAVGGNMITTTAATGQFTGTPTISDMLSVNLPAAGAAGGGSPGSIAFTLFTQNHTKALNLEITAAESDGKAKAISSPRVLTANNLEASIEQGTQIPYQVASSSGATAVSFIKATLSLKVKPQITPDGNIIMNLTVANDSIGDVTAAGLSINTKNVTTQVLVENGGTVVIGGIYTQTLNTNVAKVPFFGDLPGVGVLFRNTTRLDKKSELLVFITPRIVEDRLGQR